MFTTYHQPGPSGLPESVQGATLWQSVLRAASYVTSSPGGLPAMWANALARRMAPVAELLRVAGESVKLLETQLGESIDAHHREQERAMAAEAKLADAHVLIAELAQALKDDEDHLSERSRELLIARAEAAILPPGL